MMTRLSRTVSGFGQLIVVDEAFEVLYRAWCVAEIVEANVLSIPARIKVFSQHAVDLNYDKLSLLDVRDCSASSGPDKEMILSKIVDIDAFNLRLQQLVFSTEGLFSEWVDGKERSRQVGRILRRSTQAFPAGAHMKTSGCCSARCFLARYQLEEESDDSSDDDLETSSEST
mmetsp:Transcript_11186/g.25775  ORF Transcript_11186/g.25775 Transcript_11186/m.25775 type:complete len:172 (+) Transcript_11186:162-677(+)